MSYKKPDTGNTMNDYFTALSDFNMLSNNLLSAKTESSFTIWLEKLIAIDKRATYLFILMRQEDSDLYRSEMNCQSAARLTFC